ncbi:MAG: hypothetical protein AMS20_16350 [Gemmatimonas sp. SG8_28]|nr:MAG: hypothetical protein AMS20_16350 [Gemmatimonas sp. SG8_28]
MSRIRTSALAIGAAALLWGCGGESGSDDTEVRDLSLAPAESIAALDDAPQSAPAPQQGGQQTAAPSTAAPPRTPPRTSPPAPPAPMSLAAGTVVTLTASDSISTRTHAAGDVVYATASADIVDGQGRVVIPAGARFEGVIAAILEAKNPGDPGTISLAFNRVAFGGKSYSVDATSDSVATERQGRGVTGGDAAKVGVGAAAGAVLGGLITKDTKGAIVGGVVGAAAGAGVAGATKDADVLLPAGGTIRIVLGSPMVLTPIS